MQRSTSLQQKGLTLIEVMVGIVIGLLAILAASSVLLVGTKHQRSTVASSNLGQDATLIHNIFDQSIRSAGAGFLHGNNWSPLGCTLNASYNSQALLPLPSTAPEFLGGFLTNNQIPLAPVLIASGINNNSVIVSMSGSQEVGAAPQEISDSDGSGKILTVNTGLGLRNGEFIVVNRADNSAHCHLAQVSTVTGNKVTLSDNYAPGVDANNPGAKSPLSNLGQEPTFFSTLGNMSNGTLEMSAFGVNAQGELQQFNLLSQDAPATLATNVVAMYAIYGIVNEAGTMSWQLPTGDYDFSTLVGKSKPDISELLRNIAAVRLSILVKNPQAQDQDVAEAEIQHFKDVLSSASIKTAIGSSDKKYNHQLLEFTIPLRNALFSRKLVNANEQ